MECEFVSNYHCDPDFHNGGKVEAEFLIRTLQKEEYQQEFPVVWAACGEHLGKALREVAPLWPKNQVVVQFVQLGEANG
jgi:hypothetical protein